MSEVIIKGLYIMCTRVYGDMCINLSVFQFERIFEEHFDSSIIFYVNFQTNQEYGVLRVEPGLKRVRKSRIF